MRRQSTNGRYQQAEREYLNIGDRARDADIRVVSTVEAQCVKCVMCVMCVMCVISLVGRKLSRRRKRRTTTGL